MLLISRAIVCVLFDHENSIIDKSDLNKCPTISLASIPSRSRTYLPINHKIHTSKAFLSLFFIYIILQWEGTEGKLMIQE